MPSSLISDPKNSDLLLAGSLHTDSVLPLVQPPPCPFGDKFVSNSQQKSLGFPILIPDQVIKTEPPAEAKVKANVTARRRSARVSVFPNRFQPESRRRKLTNSLKGIISESLGNTLEFSLTNGSPEAETTFAAMPVPRGSVANSCKPAKSRSLPTTVGRTVEFVLSLGLEIDSEIPAKRLDVEAIPPETGYNKHQSKENKDTVAWESIGDTIVQTITAPPKRSHAKKKTLPRKPKVIVEEITTNPVTTEEETHIPPSGASIWSRKRSLGEETVEGKLLYKKHASDNSQRRKSLNIETPTRKTRSQNAVASSAEPPVSALPTSLRIPISKVRSAKTPYIAPRLSSTHFVNPLRAMIGSAIFHYSTLPTNLTDSEAVSNLYRTFCALDTYHKHLVALGLEGDDQDVRKVMLQVWQLVDSGERDEGVVWKMLVTAWDSQGANGWGNNARV